MSYGYDACINASVVLIICTRQNFNTAVPFRFQGPCDSLWKCVWLREVGSSTQTAASLSLLQQPPILDILISSTYYTFHSKFVYNISLMFVFKPTLLYTLTHSHMYTYNFTLPCSFCFNQAELIFTPVGQLH